MDLVLRPMTADEWEPWNVQQAAGYVEQLVEMGGLTLTDAEAKAARDDESLLPDGMATAGHRFLVAEHDGQPVAWLWLGVADDPTTPATVWVYDVEVHAGSRGQGIGRRVMELAEEVVRDMGGTSIMLNVFAGNEVARSLYDSLGYEVVESRPSGHNMHKDLASP